MRTANAITPRRFEAEYAPDDCKIAAGLLLEPDVEPRTGVDRTAIRLIEAVRSATGGLGGIEELLREFSLSTREGLALMVLAEALLRVPDDRTADQFIETQLGQGDFVHHETASSAFLVNASAWALATSARLIQAGEDPAGTLGHLVKRIGVPAIRSAIRQAMRLTSDRPDPTSTPLPTTLADIGSRSMVRPASGSASPA